MILGKSELKEWQIDMESEDGYFGIYSLRKSDVLEDTPGAKDVGYEGLQIVGERKKGGDGVE